MASEMAKDFSAKENPQSDPGSVERSENSESSTDDHRPSVAKKSQTKIKGTEETVWRRMLFMRQFEYDDISLHVDGQDLLVNAEHKDYVDEHGIVRREFGRLYRLPDNLIVEKLTSYMSGYGVLVIEAPLTRSSQVK